MTIAKRAMTIAADTCIYTNSNWTIDSLTKAEASAEGAEGAGGGAPDGGAAAGAAVAAAPPDAAAAPAQAPAAS